MALQHTPIPRIGLQPLSVMGGDRELVMFAGLISFALAFAAITWLATVFAIALWTVSLFVLRRMFKSDPLLRFVYMRQLGYRRYYGARSTPFRINTAGQAARYR